MRHTTCSVHKPSLLTLCQYLHNNRQAEAYTLCF